MAEFTGLQQEHFEAFLPEKWSSNVHNLIRMRVKDTMLALSNLVHNNLQEELAGLTQKASDEIPNISNQKKVDAQWIYWYRDESARKSLASFLEKTPLDKGRLFNIAPQDKHLTLAIIIRQTEIWVGLHLAPGAVVDRRNFSILLEKAWQREQYLDLLKDLPERVLSGFINEPQDITAIDDKKLVELSEQLTPDHPAWQIGYSISQEEAIHLSTDLVDLIIRWVGVFIPHYRFLAWSKSNDHIEVGKQLQEEKAQKRRKALGLKNGDRVRIVSGMFAGKTGVVQDIDTKAQVKVQVGKMSVVVAGSDLIAAV